MLLMLCVWKNTYSTYWGFKSDLVTERMLMFVCVWVIWLSPGGDLAPAPLLGIMEAMCP